MNSKRHLRKKRHTLKKYKGGRRYEPPPPPYIPTGPITDEQQERYMQLMELYNRLIDEYDAIDMERNTVLERYQHLRQRSSGIMQDLKAQQYEIINLNKELAAFRNENYFLNGKIEDCEEYLRKLQAENASLKENCKNLKRDYQDMVGYNKGY
jgi:DNA repair exonuclease SbcCD ATPase subunit